MSLFTFRTFVFLFSSIILNAHPFQYHQETVKVDKKMLEQRKDFSIWKWTFKSPFTTKWEANNFVVVYILRPPNPRGKVLVLHTLGTKDLELEKEICRRFSQLGYESAALVMPYHLERLPTGLKKGWGFIASPPVMRDTLIQSVCDVRRFLDLWCDDGEKIAVVGLSLGSIVGTLAMAVDDRIGSGAFIMGGGNFTLLIPHSLIFASKSYKWKRDQLDVLDDVDPIHYAHLIPPRPVLMVNGRLDIVIPYNCSYALWKAMEKPEIEWVWSGHYGALLLKDKILRKALKFITENLNKEVH